MNDDQSYFLKLADEVNYNAYKSNLGLQSQRSFSLADNSFLLEEIEQKLQQMSLVVFQIPEIPDNEPGIFETEQGEILIVLNRLNRETSDYFKNIEESIYRRESLDPDKNEAQFFQLRELASIKKDYLTILGISNELTLKVDLYYNSLRK